MIEYYNRSAYGLNLLFRIHGSAAYRAFLPGFVAVGFFYLIRAIRGDWEEPENRDVGHPYAIGTILASITFFLVFRLQAGYGRYWEACSCVYNMMSKFMDAIIHTASYHMQCGHYDSIRPPSYFDHPELNELCYTRDREGIEDPNRDQTLHIRHRVKDKSIEKVAPRTKPRLEVSLSKKGSNSSKQSFISGGEADNYPTPLEGRARLDGNWGNLFDDGKATYFNPNDPYDVSPKGFASCQGGHSPPLFLQELAHLGSLLNGVALSTLRNDIEGATSPLDIYVPGSPWPEVDPSALDMTYKVNDIWSKIRTFLGAGRAPESRTRYNASRPLPILGGVSDAEIRFLQMARGPYAKTQLCFHWISTFFIQEHLAGSTGAVGPPIISRISQFLSDGMVSYNNARKIMFIPFPFSHAQLSVLAILVSIPLVALLMDQWTNQLWVGSLLTFLSVSSLSGIHETARELENPFRNVPNELPLVTLQAQFNETLITMFAGYHPDAYFLDEDKFFHPQARKAQSASPQRETEEPGNVPFAQDIHLLQVKIDEQARQIQELMTMVRSHPK